jgi:hypothetical protein
MSATPHPLSRPRPAVIARRWPYAGEGQKTLLLAAGMALIASFLPWLSTPVGNMSGMHGPGVWTLYAAVLGIAGAMIKWRRVALLHALPLGVAATLLPVWQLLRIADRVGWFAGWAPATGMVLAFGAGRLALRAAWRLHTER